MGIPSYFSYIIKKHGKIVKVLKQSKLVHNLYLDSNSIIYDSLRKMNKKNTETTLHFERRLYNNICLKIEEYISIVNPLKTVFIAFDGVAPVAKLEQQRTRRYKSHFIRNVEREIKKSDTKLTSDPSIDIWDQTAITPGTTFMKNLDIYVEQHFEAFRQTPNCCFNKVIVSGSQHVGEGEHKIFNFIRQNKQYHSNTTSFIYGLDADLIMLCLNHLHISKKLFLFREAPEYVKNLNDELEPDEICYLDILELSSAIIGEMSDHKNFPDVIKTRKIYDYIFISFMMGNDFMPHFPALNIRTTGISILLDTYKSIIKPNMCLYDGVKIYWRNFKLLIRELAKNEELNLKREYKTRDNWEKRRCPDKTIEDKLNKFTNIPTKNRDSEKYIDPYSYGWQHRYYERLFKMDITNEYKKKICTNYLEGLEWTMKYYTSGCINYRWLYKYHYPPLLNDLVRYIPEFDTEMIDENMCSVSALTQLCYVLPKPSLGLLPNHVQTMLERKYGGNYRTDYQFIWSFCKYFWESHVDMPSVDIDELEEFVNSVKK